MDENSGYVIVASEAGDRLWQAGLSIREAILILPSNYTVCDNLFYISSGHLNGETAMLSCGRVWRAETSQTDLADLLKLEPSFVRIIFACWVILRWW